MRRSSSRLALAGLIVLLAACNRSLPTIGEVEVNVADITQFYAELGPARCARFANCCDSEETQQLLRFIPSLGSPDTCEEYHARLYERALQEALGAAEGTGIWVNPEAIEACLEAQSSCAPVDICEQAIAGRISEGEDCDLDVECRRGHCISRRNAAGHGCTYGELGSHCWFSPECTSGYYCEEETLLCLPQKEDYAECLSDYDCMSSNCMYMSQGALRYCAPRTSPEPPRIESCDGAEPML